jgi:hypothetical protein
VALDLAVVHRVRLHVSVGRPVVRSPVVRSAVLRSCICKTVEKSEDITRKGLTIAMRRCDDSGISQISGQMNSLTIAGRACNEVSEKC